MSKVIPCPKCGQPMDVPAYPGDGVYRTHWCPEPWSPIQKVRTRSRDHERIRFGEPNYDEAEEW